MFFFIMFYVCSLSNVVLFNFTRGPYLGALEIRDLELIIKRYINSPSLFYFTLISLIFVACLDTFCKCCIQFVCQLVFIPIKLFIHSDHSFKPKQRFGPAFSSLAHRDQDQKLWNKWLPTRPNSVLSPWTQTSRLLFVENINNFEILWILQLLTDHPRPLSCLFAASCACHHLIVWCLSWLKYNGALLLSQETCADVQDIVRSSKVSGNSQK